jgi:hypothetical protein
MTFDNIFLKDFNDDGEALLETYDDNNDNNNSNGGKGHDGSDGDAFDGWREHRWEGPPINPGNVHHEGVYNWNEINEEMANGVDEHAVEGSIRNMHVDEDALVGSIERSYDRADENNNISKGRRLKQLVKTKIRDNVQNLCNLTSEVEREVPMNFGDGEQVLGNDEITNSDGIDREEAPCDGDVIIPCIVTSNVGILSVNLRPRRYNRASQ